MMSKRCSVTFVSLVFSGVIVETADCIKNSVLSMGSPVLLSSRHCAEKLSSLRSN